VCRARPRDELHDEEVGAVVGGVEVEEGGDVRVGEAREAKASFRKRLRAFSSASDPAGRTLRATSRESFVSRAR